MQLKLTWRVLEQNKDINVLVSDEQELIETMHVMYEKGLISKEKMEATSYVQGMRSKKHINLLLTYKEANIYSGDILLI